MSLRVRTLIPLVVVLVIIAIVATYLLTPKAPRLTIDEAIEKLIGKAPRGIIVESRAFSYGGLIPKKYTCDGLDISPPIHWSNIPTNAKSIAILVIDPDAPRGIFIHWLIYNVPITISELPEAIPKSLDTKVDKVSVLQAINDFGNPGYGGPCPPVGSKHRYVFIVLALSKERIDIRGVTARELINYLKPYIISYGYTYGTYSR